MCKKSRPKLFRFNVCFCFFTIRLEEFESGNNQDIKNEPEEEKEEKDLTMKEKLSKLAAEEKKNKMNKQQRYKVDSNALDLLMCIADVYEDYSCMLNQTNIGANNNKFYVIQLLHNSNTFYLWTRWGRVVILFSFQLVKI